MLEQCCNHSKQCRNNVVMLCCAKYRGCESFRPSSPCFSNPVQSIFYHSRFIVPLSSDVCDSWPFIAIKTRLHNEGTYRDGEKFTVSEEVSQKSDMLNICWFPFYWTNGWKEAQLRWYLESLITLFSSYRCGSVIVDLTLSFSALVTEKRILYILKDATKDGKLGSFNVDASSNKGTQPEIPVTTRPGIGKTTSKLPDGTILSKKCFLLT